MKCGLLERGILILLECRRGSDLVVGNHKMEEMRIRIRFRDSTCLCNRISYGGGVLLFITTTENEVYIVNCENESTALKMYKEALTEGRLDISEFEYAK